MRLRVCMCTKDVFFVASYQLSVRDTYLTGYFKETQQRPEETPPNHTRNVYLVHILQANLGDTRMRYNF